MQKGIEREKRADEKKEGEGGRKREKETESESRKRGVRTSGRGGVSSSKPVFTGCVNKIIIFIAGHSHF